MRATISASGDEGALDQEMQECGAKGIRENVCIYTRCAWNEYKSRIVESTERKPVLTVEEQCWVEGAGILDGLSLTVWS